MIVTGRYATSTGYEFTPVPDGMARAINLFNPEETRYMAESVESNPLFDNQGLPAEEITFAETLKDAGYYTAHPYGCLKNLLLIFTRISRTL